MGRSVSTPSNARHVLYLDWVPDEDTLEEMVTESLEINEVTDLCRHDREAWGQGMIEDEWDYVIEDFQLNVLGDLFPSVDSVRDRWLGNEDRIVAENGHAIFGVSEYMGLAALWVVVNPRAEGDGWYGAGDYTKLAKHWIDQAWPKIEERYPHRLYQAGRFSNGEAVYRRAEQ